MSSVLWRALSVAFTVASGAVATRLLAVGWKAATGHTPPSKPESPEVGTAEAVAFAALAGALLNVVRVLATRRAAAYYVKRSGGRLPTALRDAF